MSIVDQQGNRFPVSQVRHQPVQAVQDRGHAITIDPLAAATLEYRRGKACGSVQQLRSGVDLRPQQLSHRGKRRLHHELVTPNAQCDHVQLVGSLAAGCQQARLADPRGALDHDQATVT